MTTSAWHVHPAVDSLAYHWSWVPPLAVLLTVGRGQPEYLPVLLVVLAIGFSHRHLTLPYVYLDRQVFRAHPWRFTVLPLGLLFLFLASPWLARTSVFGAVVVVAALWNLWHVLMQKYGILRMYLAKSGLPDERRTPGWADRALILGWLPLYVAYLGPRYRGVILDELGAGAAHLAPVLDALGRAQGWLVPLTAVGLLAAMLAFVVSEWRGPRFGVRPRLLMALGTTLLSASMLVCDPVQVYLAYGFSHAVEYTVFVWSFQRRRYGRELPHRPLLQRLLAWPLAYYATLVVGLGALYLLLRFWGVHVFAGQPAPTLGGASTRQWMFYWAVCQSMMHFYFDGFLWKLRLPALRADL